MTKENKYKYRKEVIFTEERTPWKPTKLCILIMSNVWLEKRTNPSFRFDVIVG